MGVSRSDIGLPHFLASETPSGGGEELQSEYFVDLEHAAAAVQALFSVSDKLKEYVLVTEFRVTRSDAFPLSLCYARGEQLCVGIHFTWKNQYNAVITRMVPLVEKTLAAFRPRPHHGKLRRSASGVAKRFRFRKVAELAFGMTQVGDSRTGFCFPGIGANNSRADQEVKRAASVVMMARHVKRAVARANIF